MTNGQRIASIVAAICLVIPVTVGAQTRSVRDAGTAYGARLNARGQIDDLNQSRINNRIDNRLDTRLSLRLERYRPDSIADPAAAFATPVTDKSRVGASTDPLPHQNVGDRPQ